MNPLIGYSLFNLFKCVIDRMCKWEFHSTIEACTPLYCKNKFYSSDLKAERKINSYKNSTIGLQRRVLFYTFHTLPIAIHYLTIVWQINWLLCLLYRTVISSLAFIRSALEPRFVFTIVVSPLYFVRYRNENFCCDITVKLL